MAGVPTTRTPGAPYAGEFLSFAPAIIDVETGQVHAIPGPFAGDQSLSNREIIALQRGPFVKVTGTESCLNVRSAPAADASSLECVADGVLLLDVLHASKIASATPITGWFDVTTPDGIHGYANAQYLQPMPGSAQ
jgi:hypothetical protein